MVLQAISFTLPILIIQIYLFVKPALYKNIKKMAIVGIPIVSSLFLLGVIVSFVYLVPTLLIFFLSVSASINVNTVYSFMDFFNFVFTICIVSGLIVELPALISFLTLLNVLNAEILIRLRRISYPLLCLLAVIITPPDFFSGLILMIVLFGLFEVSILLSKVFAKVNKE